MLDNKQHTGNRVDEPDFLKVLLTLKRNIMVDLNVAEVCKVIEVKGDVYTVSPINKSNVKLKCYKLASLEPQKDDLVLVIFTNTDYRLNLNKINNNKPTQTIADELLHSLNYGIITGSVGNSGSITLGTRVTVGGVVQRTWNADTKADVSALANYLPLTGGQLTGNLSFKGSKGINIGNYLLYSSNNNNAIVIESTNDPYVMPFYYERNVLTKIGESNTELQLSGSEERPLYKTNYLALEKDITNHPEIVYDSNTQQFDGLIHNEGGDRVIEIYISSDGRTWYRKWASGWKECGGERAIGTVGSNATINVTQTLPIIFNKIILGIGSTRIDLSASGDGSVSINVGEYDYTSTATKIKIYIYHSPTGEQATGVIANYYVCGY